MCKLFFAWMAWMALLLGGPTCLAADLTATERRWLQGMAPVIDFARQAGLALDIVVQPQPTPELAPLALAFVDGRCKLVLSMRGNPQAQATLEHINPPLLEATLQLMAAHELGHCRRYLDGAFYALPVGFTAPELPAALSPDLKVEYLAMQAVRREEGFGDLVGLAWVQQHHPQRYAALYTWLLAERSNDRVPGSHHDTLVWLRLVQDGSVLAGSSIFERPNALWAAGIAADE